MVGQSCHLLFPDPDHFILLAESTEPMNSPGYDHLGLLQDTHEEVDGLLVGESATPTRTTESRLCATTISPIPNSPVHAFYVKYLLPIYLTSKAWSGRHRGLTITSSCR